MTTRTFNYNEAVRANSRLNIGLTGPSGGGKTVSALELAHGMQEVFGGDIAMSDTENDRGLAYAGAKRFSDPTKVYKFKHIPFGAPFSPLDYLAALEFILAKKPSIVITDSMSHEHEGPGGVLEMHTAEVIRLMAEWKCQEGTATFPAWAKPKAERRRLINCILQMPAMFIWCFRAKEKTKMVTTGEYTGRDGKLREKKEPQSQGFMAIAGEEFVYEMTQGLLLPPNAKGVPKMSSDEPGEQVTIKNFGPFDAIFKESKPLSVWHGRQMARWAKGDVDTSAPATAPATAAPAPAASEPAPTPAGQDQGKL